MSVKEETNVTTTIIQPENETSEITVRSKYVSKKTVAQGMFDVALLSSNANQLVQLVEFNNFTSQSSIDKTTSPLYIVALVFLSISITLQVIVGVLLLAIGLMHSEIRRDAAKKALSKRLNNIATIIIFIITLISILIPSFTSGLIPSRTHPRASC